MSNSQPSLILSIVSAGDVRRYAENKPSRTSDREIESLLLDDERAREILLAHDNPPGPDILPGHAQDVLKSCFNEWRKCVSTYTRLTEMNIPLSAKKFAKNRLHQLDRLMDQLEGSFKLPQDAEIEPENTGKTSADPLEAASTCDFDLIKSLHALFEAVVSPFRKAEIAGWISAQELETARVLWFERAKLK